MGKKCSGKRNEKKIVMVGRRRKERRGMGKNRNGLGIRD